MLTESKPATAMSQEKVHDQTIPEKVNKTPKRRLVPNIPAIQNFLKRELGGDFATGLKERGKKEPVKAITMPPMSPDERRFQAMLLANINSREDKGKDTL